MIRPGYRFVNDADTIRRLSEKDEAHGAMLRQVRQETEYVLTHFDDKPEWLSGWGHDFVCPKCASQMHIDLDMPYHAPNTFHCPNCGTEASGEAYDAAWVYYYRIGFANKLNSVAICALLGDRDARDFIIRYMDFYADHYSEFPVHGKHAGRGKVMEQSLDEAVWGITLIRALLALREEIPQEKRRTWKEKLFDPMAQLLIPQANKIHNIPTWLMCCIGAIGLYFEDDALLTHAMGSEFGIRNQIAEGFTADGFWNECSMTYHYYTLSALTNFLTLYAEKEPNDPICTALEQMYVAPYILSADGYRLPAINDGWYPNSIVGSAVMIQLAVRVFHSEALEAQLRVIRKVAPERLLYPTALLYEFDENPNVILYAATRLAILREPMHAILKAGVLVQSHKHEDYLSLILAPFSDDLGTPGYAHPLTRSWYRIAPSHNTFTMDGKHPGAVYPCAIRQIPDGALAELNASNWCDMTAGTRALTREGDTLVDRMHLSAASEHVFDWLFHSIGDIACDAPGVSIDSLGNGPGYEHFTDIRRMKAEETFSVSFTLQEIGTLTLTVPNAADYEIYLALSPDNPASKKRTSLLLRRRTSSADFTVHYTRTYTSAKEFGEK